MISKAYTDVISDILITKADEGNKVILEKSDYVRKVHYLLHDNSTCQKLRSIHCPLQISDALLLDALTPFFIVLEC